MRNYKCSASFYGISESRHDELLKDLAREIATGKKAFGVNAACLTGDFRLNVSLEALCKTTPNEKHIMQAFLSGEELYEEAKERVAESLVRSFSYFCWNKEDDRTLVALNQNLLKAKGDLFLFEGLSRCFAQIMNERWTRIDFCTVNVYGRPDEHCHSYTLLYTGEMLDADELASHYLDSLSN